MTNPDIASLTSEAIACYQQDDFSGTQQHAKVVLQSMATARQQALCYQLLGLIAHKNGHYEEAVSQLTQATNRQPDVTALRTSIAESYTALARQQRQQARLPEAEKHVREALAWQSGNSNAQNVLGVLLQEQGKFCQARELFEHALRTSPVHPSLRLNYANLLRNFDDVDTTIEQYRLAIQLRPNHVDTLLNAGVIMLEAQRVRPAIQLLQQAEQLDCDNAVVQFNLGNAFVADNQLVAAVRHYESALRLQPTWSLARANWIIQRAEICDHRNDWEEQIQLLLQELNSELESGQNSPLNVSQTHRLPVPVSLMRRIARRQTESIRSQLSKRTDCASFTISANTDHQRLRIGYLSFDFRNHATGHLMSTMFGKHDRDRFEIFCYSYGPEDGSEYRRRIEAESEHFIDLVDHTNNQMAEQIAINSIDILVDLHGYTKNSRPDVLVMRPAPLIVHYLGFPGSMGGLVDYVVSDPVLTPPDNSLRDEFDEALIFLPHTYQITDDDQLIANVRPTREQCGLPTDAFVFAAFSNNYKIQPGIFNIWMRILDAVPNSVLWLMTFQQEVVENLRYEAQRCGIDPARLVFANVLSKPEHLARHQLANLFLDTTICGAHTTATDSLWAGVPVITCAGQRYTERVAASVLSAAGLQELIVGDMAAYEQLAIALATNPERYQRLCKDWWSHRTNSHLFDTTGRVKELEAAYEAIWQQHLSGLPCTDVHVKL